MKIKPLPPLNSLVAFEASARLTSFTLAANELNVTQGAISRQIKLLETFLGKALFERHNRNIELTMIGMQYYESIAHSLNQIAFCTGDIKKWQGEAKITVATTNAMAALWLLPKIAKYQEIEENVDIMIIASDNISSLDRTDFDLGLYYCDVEPKNMISSVLFSEEVFPVCSPEFYHKLDKEDLIASLFSKTLISLDEAQKNWLNWTQWFELAKLPHYKPKNRLNINNYPMVLQAAVNGQGVALGWSSIVDHYLESGALIRPVESVVMTDTNFLLLEHADKGYVPKAISKFKSWLLKGTNSSIGGKGLLK